MPRWETPDWETGPVIYRRVYLAVHGLVRVGLRVRARGGANVPREGPVILAANHLSFIDPFAIGAALPRPIHWLAKKEIFNGRFWTWFFTNGGVVPVDRAAKGGNRETFAAVLRALDEGRVVGIFPEGTRQRSAARLGEARTGVARLAFLTGAPVLPVGVATDTLYGRGMTLPRLGRRAYISFGEPLRFPRDPALAEDKEATRRATDDVMAAIGRLVGECVEARDAAVAWPAPRKFRGAAP